ncbi:asparagine synthase (glutamine-hydrolyzing) [Geitlerinema splendidum]|nr:asparagine synthase (glutamine-hydrolyzing) [Geitlerinema splendidum]
MCGICGTVGSVTANSRLLAALQRMAHRGPDCQGNRWGDRVALGHRRLAIIDLSDDGQQPMTNENGTIWLVFNGEIYNFAELRTQLEPQHHFRSRTDSEVLIHGYEQWGIEGLLQRIRGMFAFALWDEPTETLHLVRDHLGKKPLYYTQLGGGLSFASTLPALLELLGKTPEVSPSAILDYLTYLCVPSPDSIFEGVFKLPPAHRLEYRQHQNPRILRYWHPDFSQQEQLDEQEWLERLDALLKDAVRDRLVADVPLGAFLSGGVDSSLVVALMSQLSSNPVTTISVGFPQQSHNELPHARRVARLYGTQHHEQILYPDAAAVLPELIFQYGEPFADHSALPTYYLAKAARDRVKVVLTGDGGDENFAGYRGVLAVKAAQSLHRLPDGVREGLAALCRNLEKRGVRGIRKLRWVSEISRGKQGNYVFDSVGSRTFRFSKQDLFGPLLRSLAQEWDSDLLYRALWHEAGSPDWVDRALYVDLMALLPDDFLTKMDVATMAHGLEARSPLLDMRVVALSSKIPSSLKLKQWHTKRLLKRLAENYLPRDLIYRRKQGFSLPTSDWLRSDLGALLHPILLSQTARQRGYFRPEAIAHFINEHQQGIADRGQSLWALLILELWFQLFIDKTLSPSDVLSPLAGIRNG